MELDDRDFYWLQLAGRVWRAWRAYEEPYPDDLPFFVSIAFLLIAEIDAPRGVLIKVPPQNLASLAQSLTKH